MSSKESIFDNQPTSTSTSTPTSKTQNTATNVSLQSKPLVYRKASLKKKSVRSSLKSSHCDNDEQQKAIDGPLIGPTMPERASYKPLHSTPRTSPNKELLLQEIFHTVGQLEDTFIETKRCDFKLQLALDHQSEMVRDLNNSLESEKMRNKRLVQLIRGLDSASSTDEEPDHFVQSTYSLGLTRSFGDMLSNRERWQSRSSMDPFDSISPLLLQQRFDELTTSHKRCQRQLERKEKRLTQIKCRHEELLGKYDNLIKEYRQAHKRFEVLCWKYLNLQQKKNEEMIRLRTALNSASNCLWNAKNIIEKTDGVAAEDHRAFGTNFIHFIRSLELCKVKPQKK